MLNLELFAQGCDHSVVHVYTVISDDPVGDTILANEVLLDEAGNHIFVTEAKEAALTHLVKYSMATRMKRCPFEVVGLISPIMLIPHIAKGQGSVKTFRGTGDTWTLSA